MNATENVCPDSKHINELETIVCGYCGSALQDPFMDPGAKTKTTDMPALFPERMRDFPIDEATVPDRGIAVYVEGVSNPVYIDTKGEFVIGRKVDETSEGLLDLSPLGGYHLGLSRRHAIIRRTERGYEVLDLGSANGTWLNDEKLVPHKSYPLASGTHVRIGRMRLFVLYRPFGESMD
jgi:pSer/pThr/pTyr-binding forkhead associated (FHA) protein